MINLLPQNQKKLNQSKIKPYTSYTFSISKKPNWFQRIKSTLNLKFNPFYQNLLERETNLVQNLPKVEPNTEDRVVNFFLIFSIFLTSITVLIGFSSSNYQTMVERSNYLGTKIKNFLFLRSSEFDQFKIRVTYLEELETAKQKASSSELKSLDIFNRISSDLQRYGVLEDFSMVKGDSEYLLRINIKTKDSDFESKISDVKNIYPELKDVEYQSSSDADSENYQITGRISYAE